MKQIPHYTKVLTLGSSGTYNALIGDVIIQEKVDGSQFRFGLNEDGVLCFGTRKTQLHPEMIKDFEKSGAGMFKLGVKYLLSIEKKIKKTFDKDTYFYGEYLWKPKHNVLAYERTPKNYIMLFDCLKEGRWCERIELDTIAGILDLEIAPELWRGELNDKEYLEFLKNLIQDNISFLGKEIIEGIVIKNYNQPNPFFQGLPLFTKYVREQFKERMGQKNIKEKESLQDFIKSFSSEARVEKAMQHLKEEGRLFNEPKDIGAIITEVIKDIKEEEGENIKEYFFKKYMKDINREATKWIPQWYKDKLLEGLK